MPKLAVIFNGLKEVPPKQHLLANSYQESKSDPITDNSSLFINRCAYVFAGMKVNLTC